jgi:hypothetical protein
MRRFDGSTIHDEIPQRFMIICEFLGRNRGKMQATLNLHPLHRDFGVTKDGTPYRIVKKKIQAGLINIGNRKRIPINRFVYECYKGKEIETGGKGKKGITVI